MSSKFFPSYPNDNIGAKLASARTLIETVISGWQDIKVYLSDDEISADRKYIKALRAAIGKLDQCLHVDESDLAAVQSQLAIAQKVQERAEEQVEKWQSIASKLKGEQFADGVVGGIKQFVEGTQ